MPLYGDGGNVRDWIHVEDHNIAAPTSCCEHGRRRRDLQHRCAATRCTNVELTYRLLELTRPRRERSSQPVADRLGHDRRYSVNIDKVTRARLDARARRSTTALAATVEWYRDNRDWWEPLKARPASEPNQGIVRR